MLPGDGGGRRSCNGGLAVACTAGLLLPEARAVPVELGLVELLRAMGASVYVW